MPVSSTTLLCWAAPLLIYGATGLKTGKQLPAPGPLLPSIQKGPTCQSGLELSSSLAVPNEELLARDSTCDRPAFPYLTKLLIHETRLREFRALPKAPELMFYGDSITEQWREQCMGADCVNVVPPPYIFQKATGDKETFRTQFVERYGGTASVMAVGGDRTVDLLWRLQHGEAPQATPRVISLLVGINDLGEQGAYCHVRGYKKGFAMNPLLCETTSEDTFGPAHAEKVYFGVKAVIQELWKKCRAPIVLSGLFPTGKFWPEGSFGKTVPHLNHLLAELAQSSSNDLHFVDCSWAVLDNKTGHIDTAMMPDYIHPGQEGMRRWAECLKPVMDKVLLGA